MKVNCFLRLAERVIPMFFVAFGLLTTAFAESGTWLFNPVNGDWNTPANWSSNSVPNSPSDTATFDTSIVTNVSLSASVVVDSVVFDSGASSYTITCPSGQTLSIEGTGIANQSGTVQTFVASGGLLKFTGTDKAGRTALIATAGGTIEFDNEANGGQASVLLDNGGTLRLTNGANGQTSIGSLEGDGQVTISGYRALEVGGDNRSTTFSGVISGGSLIKTGSGTLTLTGANTYDHTALRRGTLLVNNTTGSGTGGIRVRVFGGILGGTGYINGKTTIDGTLGGAWLSPGVDGPGTLRFGQYLIIGSLATFSCELDTVTHEVEGFRPAGGYWLRCSVQSHCFG